MAFGESGVFIIKTDAGLLSANSQNGIVEPGYFDIKILREEQGYV